MNGGWLLWALIGAFLGLAVAEKLLEAYRRRRDPYWSMNDR